MLSADDKKILPQKNTDSILFNLDNKFKAMKKQLLALVCLISLSVQAQNWTSMSAYPGGNVNEQSGFSIGNKGYITGASNELYEYDATNDTWTAKANFAGPARGSAAGFSIGNTGYISTGGSYADLWAYDAGSDSWSQKANFPGAGREGAVAAAAGGKGYLGLGGSYFNDWYEYNPATNSWTQKAPIPGPGRYHACAFELNGKIYVVGGFGGGTFFNDVFEYDPAGDTWTTKNPFPGTARDRQEGVSSNGKGYMYYGWSGSSSLSDCWEYDAASDTWTQMPSAPGSTYNGMGLAISGSIYGGLGTGGSSWNKLGLCAPRIFNVQANTCFGANNGSIELTQPSGAALVSALWTNPMPPITGPLLAGITAGTYTVIVEDSSGCITTENVTLNGPAAITFSTAITPNECAGGNEASICITINGGTPPYTFNWAVPVFGNNNCIDSLPAGQYAFQVSDSNSCSLLDSVVLNDPPAPNIMENAGAASCATCNDGFANVSIAGGNTFYEVSWSNGVNAFNNPNLSPGWYSYCVIDSNLCQYCDSILVGNLLGIKEESGISVAAGPNPFKDHLLISNPENKLIRFEMFESKGQMIQSGMLRENHLLKTDMLSQGFYLLRISGEQGSQWFKLVKE